LPSPAIGRVPLAKLTPEDVGRMLSGLAARGDLSPTTVRYAYSVLRISLGRALKAGKVHRNVATLVDPPAKATVEIHPLNADQIATFLASLRGDESKKRPPDTLEALYVMAIATGMRQGELLALRWSDVDEKTGEIIIRHALERGSRRL